MTGRRAFDKVAETAWPANVARIGRTAFVLISVAFIGCCGLYFLSILFALHSGRPLPSASIFADVPELRRIEPFIPLWIVGFAGAGALLSWVAALNRSMLPQWRRAEIDLIRLWSWAGCPVIICLLLLFVSAGGWSGAIRDFEPHYQNLGGLLPYSDANNYFNAAIERAFSGIWNNVGSRRPLAQAFRDLTVLLAELAPAPNLYIGAILVQLILVALSLFVAARAVVQWRGLWAGLAFCGLMFILARPFVGSTETEALGLVWALLALAVFVKGFRLDSAPHALTGIAILTVALWTRMGSLLLLPLLVVWFAWIYAKSPSSRIRAIALACCAIVVAVVTSGLLAAFYGLPGVTTGGNFAYTLCGLAHGQNWSFCANNFANELQALPNEASQNSFLLERALEGFSQNPRAWLSLLVRNVKTYLRDVPGFMVRGNAPAYLVSKFATDAFVLALVPGMIYSLRRLSSRAELTFWLVLFLGTTLSAMIILQDDGWRVLVVTHAAVICFFSQGFATPRTVVMRGRADTMLSWRALAGVTGIALISLVIAPSLSRIVVKHAALSRLETLGNQSNQTLLLGSQRLVGFLVLADGEPLSMTAPSLHFSEFAKLIAIARLENEFGPFVADSRPLVPFAFVSGIGPAMRNRINIFIAPPELLQKSEVAVWQVVITPWNVQRSTSILRRIVSASPVPSPP